MTTPELEAQKAIEAARPHIEDDLAKADEILGEALQNPGGSFFSKLWGEAWTTMGDNAFDIAKKVLPGIGFLFDTREIVNEIAELKKLTLSVDSVDLQWERIQEWGNTHPVTATLLGIVGSVVMLGLFVTTIIRIRSEKAYQLVMKEETPSIPTVQELYEAFYRNPARRDAITDYLERLGLSDYAQELLEEINQVLLDGTVLRSLFLRNEITEEEHDTRMKKLRFQPEDIAQLKKLYFYIPPVGDLVTMAVREVFTPDIVEEYGLMDEFPGEFAEWAKKQGVSEFWAKAYWGGHWVLPSVTNAFEMFHRRVIDRTQLDTLLRTQDVMPYWRDKLTAIAYRPFTRVDVRRMYRVGTLDADDVYESYLDIGFSPEKADAMTDFTIRYETQEDKGLSKADIMTMYKQGALAVNEVYDYLAILGYSEEAIFAYIAKADFEVFQKLKKDSLALVEKLYVTGRWDRNKVIDYLGRLNLSANESNALFEKWDMQKELKWRVLSLADLKAFFAADVITDTQLEDELIELGYNDQDRYRFMTLFRKGKEKG